jgi:hypothetical protein
MAQAKHETRDIRIPPIGLAGTLLSREMPMHLSLSRMEAAQVG